MEFSIELYEAPDGRPVVEEELEVIERSVPVLYDLLVAGMNKLRRREYHRPPLCESLGGGVFELRVGRKDIARAAWFFQAGQRIVVVRCFVKKSPKTPPAELELAHKRMTEYLSR
jgi:phage-related protein